MKKVPAKYLAWFLWAFFVGVLFGVIGLVPRLVPSVMVHTVPEEIASAVAFTAMATVGAIVASRRPENPIGWLMLAFPVIGATAEAIAIYARYAIHANPGALPGGATVGLLTNSLWPIAYGLILPFIPLLFPRGRLLSPRWRWVGWGMGAAIAAIIVTEAFSPEVAVQDNLKIPPPVANPLAIVSAEPILDAVFTAAAVIIAMLWVAVGVSLVLRFARSSGEERQQIKWFAYTGAIFAVFMVAVIVFNVSGHLAEMLIPAFLLLLTAGMAVAILKHRLYDIDILINRTLVYGVMTAMLAGTYFGGVVLLQMAFRAVTGQENAVAIVISTLAIAALFMPLRGRIQNIIDRRFYRRKYDAARTLAAFSIRMRDEVDLEKLTGELVTVVRETMQPAYVSLWMRKSGNEPSRSA